MIQKNGTFSIDFSSKPPVRTFHKVPTSGEVIELDPDGVLIHHFGEELERTEVQVGEISQYFHNKIWELIYKEREGRIFNCHQAAAYFQGRDTSRDPWVPAGKPNSLEQGLLETEAPCWMQLRKKGQLFPYHSLVPLAVNKANIRPETVFAYQKHCDNGEGSILPVSIILAMYDYDEDVDEMAFHAFPNA